MKKIKILIIDDEEDNCDQLSGFVERFDFTDVKKCYDSYAAIELLSENDFDLVISDVGLPNINGIEIAKIAGNKKNKPDIILISGKEDIINSINALELGVTYQYRKTRFDYKKLKRKKNR